MKKVDKAQTIKNIKNEMNKKSISILDLADSIQSEESKITMILEGNAEIDIMTFINISNALHVNYSELLATC